MSEWSLKRFWKSAQSAAVEGGYRVELDGRPVKTPAKQTLILPTQALADAIAQEWDAQEKEVSPDNMPLTRLSNSALDKVTHQHADVAAMLAEYGGSDLLCYRADRPDELVRRQSETWDALLEWAAQDLGVSLNAQSGLMPFEQPAASMARVSELTVALDPFALTAFHEVVALSGSWVIGMAAMKESHGVDDLWNASILDELFQAEKWGDDDEAIELRAVKRAAFTTANHFWQLCR